MLVAKTPNEFLVYCYVLHYVREENRRDFTASEIKTNLDLNLQEKTIEKYLKKVLTTLKPSDTINTEKGRVSERLR